MVWWAWFVLAALLMGMELMVLDVAFYLMFIGVAAALTGLVALAGIALSVSQQWILFAVLSVICMLAFRKRLYEKLRGDSPGYDATPKGESLTLKEDLAPGGKCRMSFRGSDWTVKNSGAETITEGSSAIVKKVEGLTLLIGD